MNRLSKWSVPAVLGGLVLAGPAVSVARAQVINPNLNPGLLPGTGNLLGTNPFLGYGNLAGGYGGYGGYGYGGNSPLYWDPYGGYLRGAASVYEGQATFVKAREEAKILREQARQEKVKTRKMMFDQWLDEQRKLPTPEQVRQKQYENEVLRSVNNPATTEVTSGTPMNYLLGPLSELIDRDRSGVKPMPLDRDLVRRLNVTKGDGFGNAGLLRNEGKLNIPVAIATLAPVDDTKALIRDLETFSRLAYEQASGGGPVDANVIRQLEDITKKLSERLSRNINDYDFAEYNEGRRFLRGLTDALTLLRQPDASRWVSGQFAAQGSTVQELVKNMTSKGLRFAPANPGDEPAYSSVHRAMVTLYNALKGPPARAAAAGGSAVVTEKK